MLTYSRKKPIRGSRPALTIAQILDWADEYHAATGRWPQAGKSRVPGLDGSTWAAIDFALRKGNRGLTVRTTLARLLQAERNVRNCKNQPDLNIRQIIDWADAYYLRFQRWPTTSSGFVLEQPTDTWAAIDSVLCAGRRGLPGGYSLARLLAEHRGRKNHKALWQISIDAILDWADLHFQRCGKWPNHRSGRVTAAPRETWYAIDAVLRHGRRGLPAGSSLIKLLIEKRSIDSPRYRPVLNPAQIVAWAEAYRARHGNWPTETSGPIPESDGETWRAVAAALSRGYRGLPGGTTLSRFLRLSAVQNCS
jgi:hypothetical protein